MRLLGHAQRRVGLEGVRTTDIAGRHGCHLTYCGGRQYSYNGWVLSLGHHKVRGIARCRAADRPLRSVGYILNGGCARVGALAAQQFRL